MSPLPALLLALVAQLGSPAFREREAASALLVELAPASVASLQRAAHAEDPEVRRRALSALEECHRWGPCPLPWVDMLPDWPDKPGIVSRCLEQAGWPHGGCHGDDWPHYRQATLHLIAEPHAAGWERWRIERLLEQMQANEREYRRKHPPTANIAAPDGSG